ncbi:heterokaryon incompatibility protein-domain-containing protein [Podospora appendiculata]|uniref:Heterokaryon incompatibility protein-domain-containing protein n=1 Tax=Podospora appendiculata TaxID=314037 RepID=A0AAE0XLX4_9PEZI|nr:heterokaryon incompatibility protein-domain-containing protein [Podospora appendiculata]
MPTRLVDVSSMDAGGAPVLVEGVPAVVDYLALSHRWGGSKIAQTTSTNLQEHKQGIPVQSLNRTFQDAITAARKLGYRYIWIDSLCILQDSREDWTREASRMALVYQNADITLSAACATSGDTGLFQSREGQTSSVKVPCSRLRDELDPPPIPNCYFTVRKKERRDYTFTKEVAEGPLNTRAWTLQERCLSRRIVHYARTQLYWECQTSIRVESLGSNIIPGPRERSERFGDMGGALQDGFLKHLLSSASIGRAPDMDLERQKININAYSAWYYLLSDYSGRDLTVGSDKLPAISGVARVFAEHRNDTYLAGLWKGDLPSGLLWRYATARLGFQRPLSSSPRAPSWSWACWDGAIITEMDWDGRVEIEDITASVQLVGTDPFGAVKSGSLRFRGPLAPIHKLSQITMPAQQTFGLVDANVQLCDAAGAVFGNGYADSYAEVADTSSLIFCLMVVSVFVGFSPFSLQVLNAKGKWAWCLMLRETADQQVYERVGIAQVHQSAFSGPKSAITIV